MHVVEKKTFQGCCLSKELHEIQGTLVQKLTLGPVLTLSIRYWFSYAQITTKFNIYSLLTNFKKYKYIFRARGNYSLSSPPCSVLTKTQGSSSATILKSRRSRIFYLVLVCRGSVYELHQVQQGTSQISTSENRKTLWRREVPEVFCWGGEAGIIGAEVQLELLENKNDRIWSHSRFQSVGRKTCSAVQHQGKDYGMEEQWKVC